MRSKPVTSKRDSRSRNYFRITPEGDQTRLDLSFDFTAKGGVAGKAATPALKAALTKGFNQMLEDWDAAA